jgi:hypothetical protein
MNTGVPAFQAWRWAFFVPGALHTIMGISIMLFSQVRAACNAKGQRWVPVCFPFVSEGSEVDSSRCSAGAHALAAKSQLCVKRRPCAVVHPSGPPARAYPSPLA